MAVDERISDIIDLPGLQKQYDQSKKIISSLVDDIIAANQKAKINFDLLGSAKTLEDFAKSSRGAAEANKMVVTAMGELKTAAERTAAVMPVLNGHTGEYFTNIKKLEQADTQAARTMLENAKVKTEAKKQEVAEFIALSKAEVEQAKKESIELIALYKAEAEESKTKLNNYKLAVAMQKEQERQEKLHEKETLALIKKNSEYEKLRKQYGELAAEAMHLGAAFGVESEQAKLAAKTANDLNNKLILIEESVGRHQRKVGNYANATMALSQLIREAPAFANSIRTGLSAISNNLPILFDQFKMLREQVGSTGQSLKIMFGSLLSFNNLFTIGFASVMIFGKQIAEITTGVSEADKRIQEMNNSLKELDRTINESLSKELEKSEELFRIASDVGASYHAREQAIEDLLKLYPELLANISQEAFLNGQVADAQGRVADILAKKAHSEELTKTIDIIIKKRDELQKNLDEWNSSATAIGTTWRFITGDRNPAKEQQAEIEKLNKDLAEYKDLLKLVNQQLGYMANPTHSGRLRSDIELDIKAQERLRDATEAGSIVHINAITKIKTLQKELDDYLGKEEKKKKDNTVAGINEELAARQRRDKAVADLQKQRFEQEAVNNKAIADDESKTLEQRLDAYDKYVQNLLMISAIESSLEEALVRDRLNALKEKEDAYSSGKISLNKYQQKALLYDEEAAFKELEAIQERHKTRDVKTAAKAAVDKAAIRKSELEEAKREEKEYLDEVEMGHQKRLEQLEHSYSEESAVLGQNYLDGKISYAKYLKELTALRNAYEIKKLEDAIRNDNILLKQEKLTAENRAIIETRRNKNKELLTQAQGKLGKSDNPILKSLGLSDEDFRGMQQVADGIVNLNQEIMNAVDQRYQQELDALDAKKQKIEENAQAEIDAINKSGLSDIEKEKKVAQVRAQAAAQQKQLDREMAEIKRKQAIADKEAAILSIIEKTAIAVISAYNPVTPASPFIAAAVGGIGAAQLATVIARPIPQYAEGTEDHPYDGPALVGERFEREYVQEPGKDPYVIDTPTIVNLPKHTRVIPEHKLLAAGNSFLTPQLMAMIGFQQPQQMDNSALERTMREEGAATRKAIARMPQTQFVATNGELRKIVRSGNSITEYINKNNS